jgi:hypothetical protein
MIIQTGTTVLIVDESGTYTGNGVYVGQVRVVELLDGGLLRVEDDDGVRRLIGREDVIRVEGAAGRTQHKGPTGAALSARRPFRYVLALSGGSLNERSTDVSAPALGQRGLDFESPIRISARRVQSGECHMARISGVHIRPDDDPPSPEVAGPQAYDVIAFP